MPLCRKKSQKAAANAKPEPPALRPNLTPDMEDIPLPPTTKKRSESASEISEPLSIQDDDKLCHVILIRYRSAPAFSGENSELEHDVETFGPYEGIEEANWHAMAHAITPPNTTIDFEHLPKSFKKLLSRARTELSGCDGSVVFLDDGTVHIRTFQSWQPSSDEVMIYTLAKPFPRDVMMPPLEMFKSGGPMMVYLLMTEWSASAERTEGCLIGGRGHCSRVFGLYKTMEEAASACKSLRNVAFGNKSERFKMARWKGTTLASKIIDVQDKMVVAEVVPWRIGSTVLDGIEM